MKKFLLALLAAVTFSMAQSQSFTHDGFFLNLAFGIGGQSFEDKGTDGDFSIDAGGGSSELDFKIGGRVVENMMLHATFLGVRTAGLDVTYRGETRTYKNSVEQMNLYGMGVTYYMPMNFFVSGSLGIVIFALDKANEGKVDATSDKGFGFQIAAGKEWWVSDNWGLGVKAALTYGSADDQNDAGEMSGMGINVMFSATFN